eukprot:1218843-Prymnesium_polylepis.2
MGREAAHDEKGVRRERAVWGRGSRLARPHLVRDEDGRLVLGEGDEGVIRVEEAQLARVAQLLVRTQRAERRERVEGDERDGEAALDDRADRAPHELLVGLRSGARGR